MALQLEIGDGGEPLAAVEITLLRSMGAETRWRTIVEAARDSRGGEVPGRIAKAIGSGPVRMRPLLDGTELGPAGLLTGMRWNLDPQRLDQLVVELQVTQTAPSTDSAAPRRRVLYANNMRTLLDEFRHVAVPASPVSNLLESLDLSPNQSPKSDGNGLGQRGQIVQDGISDWDFVHFLVGECERLKPSGADWAPLGLCGSLNVRDGTAGKWIVTLASRAACLELGEVADRTITWGGEDGLRRIEFSEVDIGHMHPFGLTRLPAVDHVLAERGISGSDRAKWSEWRSRDLPMFIGQDEALVWSIEDRIFTPFREDRTSWTTLVRAVDRAYVPRLVTLPATPWIAVGKVVEAPTEGPWLRAQLSGFEADADRIDARIATPYSGTNGRRGLHFVPASGSEVLLQWSGHAGDVVTATANIRSEAAELSSPSLWLDAKLTEALADVEMKAVGKVMVGSDLQVHVDKKASLQSLGELHLQGDSGVARLKSGMFETGQ
jgi:hypothetical protein